MRNNDIDGDDWLDKALRSEGREHRLAYIADDGFSAEVIGRLPKPVTVPAWRHVAVVVLWFCAAVAALLIVPGVFDDVFRGAVAMFVGHRFSFADIAGVLMVFAATTWGVVVYAMRTD